MISIITFVVVAIVRYTVG